MPGPRVRNVGVVWKLKKARKEIVPPQKERALIKTLIKCFSLIKILAQ